LAATAAEFKLRLQLTAQLTGWLGSSAEIFGRIAEFRLSYTAISTITVIDDFIDTDLRQLSTTT
jgi:hypothetical protein